MEKEKILIIIYEKFLLQFLLLEAGNGKIKSLGRRKFRVYSKGYKFSIVEYILQALTLWSRELGICLVKEMVPLIPRSGKDGVDDIFLFTYRKKDGLHTLTKNIFVFNKDIKQKGALNVTKFLDFRNLIYITFDSNRTSVTRYTKGQRKIMKVVSEREDFRIKDYISGEGFFARLKRFSSLIEPAEALNLVMNSRVFPLFELRSLNGSLVEYLLSTSRLETFKGCKKLNFESFGEGHFEENVLVIGGEESRFIDNASLYLLAILSVFNLQGNFNIYLDRFGFFDFLQKQDKQVLSDQVYSKILLDFWGKALIISTKKGAKLDDVVADVDVWDGDIERQIIPMFGKVFKFTFLEKGKMILNTKKGFFIGRKRVQLNIKNLTSNFVIDSRARPIERNFDMQSVSDLVVSWLKGIEAIS